MCSVAANYSKPSKHNFISAVKKVCILLSVIFVVILFALITLNFAQNAAKTNANITMAEEVNDSQDDAQNIQQELEESVENAILDTDFSDLEQFFAENENYYSLFGVSSYQELLKALVSGELLTDFNSVFVAVLASVKENILQILSPLLLILVVILISVVFQNVHPKVSGDSVSSAIFFICFSVTALLVIYLVGGTFATIRSSITKMQNQMNAIFPILLFFMTSAGGAISVKAYQPLVLLLSNAISNIFLNLLLPIVIVVFVLGVVGGLSPKAKVKKLADFFNSLFKWIIGIVFTVYMAFMSIQGITASSADGISIKTAKYAIKNYIPLLGGYISEGFEVARVGALIIKNAVGFSGIIILLITIISPVLLIGVMQLAFKLAAGLIEPLADSHTTELFSCVSKSLSMLMVVLLGVAIMYFVVIFLMICSLSGVV